MLRMTSVLRVEIISKRVLAIMSFALLTTSIATLTNPVVHPHAPPLQPENLYWAQVVPDRYLQLIRSSYPPTDLNGYPFTWYQQATGQFHFHKQQLGLRGIQIADSYRLEIVAMANQQLPTIILAAAIANQGNAPTRLFNSDIVERIQVLLGQSFNWPLQWGGSYWVDFFESPSVGIAQIMPCESHGYPIDQLFDPQVSIKLMLEKLQESSRAALQLGISRNDWFALTLIGNNIGAGSTAGYQDYLTRSPFGTKSMKQFLDAVPASKKQLARMLGYVGYLAKYEGWRLPQEIDMRYLWSLVE